MSIVVKKEDGINITKTIFNNQSNYIELDQKYIKINDITNQLNGNVVNNKNVDEELKAK